jgi:hypothetical protein
MIEKFGYIIGKIIGYFVLWKGNREDEKTIKCINECNRVLRKE